MEKSLNELAKEAGETIACVLHGIKRSDLEAIKAKEQRLNSEEGAVYKQQLAKVASHIYKEIGEGNTLEGILYEELSKAASWEKGYDVFIDPVRKSIGRVIKQDTIMHKSATEFSTLLGLGKSSIGKASDGLALLTSLGILTGVTGGSLLHLINRNAKQMSANNAALEAKIDLYKRLGNDVREELKLSGALDTPTLEDDKAVINHFRL